MTVQTVKDSSSQLNLALVSNTTHDKRRLCPCQVSQRFVIRTFRHISHLMLTFNGFNAIVYGSHKEQVPSRTFREHSQILTNRVKFFYYPGKDTSIYTEGKHMGVLNGRFPTLDLEHIRYQQCPACHKYAILLVDVQTETVPRTDQQGNKQYHCLECRRTFAVDKNGEII